MPHNQQIPSWLDTTGKPVPRIPDRIHVATNGIVFNDDGEVLLQRRADNGWWGLPGGYLDPGESVEQGVVREVWEETGLNTRVTRFVGVYSNPEHHTVTIYSEGNIVQFVTLVFVCQRESGELQISDESTDIGYFSVTELPENTVLAHHVRISDAVQNRAEPFVR